MVALFFPGRTAGHGERQEQFVFRESQGHSRRQEEPGRRKRPKL